MASSLRRFALRLGVFCALLVGVFATHLAVAKPKLPFVVLGTLDRALSRADQLQLTQHPPGARLTLLDVLGLYEADLLVAGDAASEALDAELAQLAQLAPERRAAALDCVHHHLAEARADLAHAATPAEYVEYDATCERLREVRRLLG